MRVFLMNIHHAVSGIREMVTSDWLQYSLVAISVCRPTFVLIILLGLCLPATLSIKAGGLGIKIAIVIVNLYSASSGETPQQNQTMIKKDGLQTAAEERQR